MGVSRRARRVGAEGVGEGFGLRGLGAGVAGGVDGEADDNVGDFVAADEAGDGFEVGFEGGAVDGEQGLRGDSRGRQREPRRCGGCRRRGRACGEGHGVSVEPGCRFGGSADPAQLVYRATVKCERLEWLR